MTAFLRTGWRRVDLNKAGVGLSLAVSVHAR